MKSNKFVKKCGPFRVSSISQDRHGVRMIVYPAFTQYGEGWAITRLKGEGGGPSIFTSMALASELESFLNSAYAEESIKGWHEIINKALKLARDAELP